MSHIHVVNPDKEHLTPREGVSSGSIYYPPLTPVPKPNCASSLFYRLMLQSRNSISNLLFVNALPKMERMVGLGWIGSEMLWSVGVGGCHTGGI